MKGRLIDAALFAVVLPVVAPLWVGMCVSTVVTASTTAIFFDGLDAMTDALEREREAA